MYIDEVLIDQQRHNSTEPRLEIAPSVQQVRFRFAVLNFSHPQHVLLRYQLEGFDRDWIEAGEDRTARYAYLPAGNYRMVAQALDQNGVWASQEVSMLIHVESAWWQSRWFLLCVIALSVAAVASAARVWSVRKYKVRLRRLEEEHALERERARIARNLHDELGGSLTQIGLLADRLRRHRNMEEIEKTLGSLVRRTQGLATDLESIVWTVSPQNNSWDRLAAFASRHARLFFDGTGIECRIEGAESVPALPLAVDAQHEVLAICKEAMNNTLKHSKASRFTMGFAANDGVVEIRIQDNGAGFEPSLQEHSERNGLHNMRARADEMGARIAIESRPGAGTQISLIVPVRPATVPPFEKII
jgi:signal transduction histidine kinase